MCECKIADCRYKITLCLDKCVRNKLFGHERFLVFLFVCRFCCWCSLTLYEMKENNHFFYYTEMNESHEIWI